MRRVVAGVNTLISGSMVKKVLGIAVAAMFGVVMIGSAAGQSAHRTRRESTANRRARIAKTTAETYSHRWEVAGGGGYERFRSGKYQQQDNQVTFWASTMYALNPKLGVMGEVRGGYGFAKVGNLPQGQFLSFNPQISEYSFMAGPTYRLRKKEKYAVTGFVEAGVGLGKFDGDSKGLSAAEIGVWTGVYAPAGEVGVNVDYNVYPNIALRLTPNYLFTDFGGTVQHSKGLNAGVVYRFGRLK